MHELCNLFLAIKIRSYVSVFLFLLFPMDHNTFTVEHSRNGIVCINAELKMSTNQFSFVDKFASIQWWPVHTSVIKTSAVKFMQNMRRKIVKMSKIYECSDVTLRVNYGIQYTYSLNLIHSGPNNSNGNEFVLLTAVVRNQMCSPK